MARYIILAQSEVTANALSAFLELLGEDHIAKADKRRIVWQGNLAGSKENAVLAYESLVCRILNAASEASEVGAIPLNDVVILVDSVSPDRLNPMSIGGEMWNPSIAMLILTFPEIKWLFGICIPQKNKADFLTENHSLPSLLTKPRRDPLFDATGLRNYVRCRNKILLPLRSKRAAAIDEETSYAYFHAYAAYRFGYCADAVRSWALMDHLFGSAAHTMRKKLGKGDAEGGHGFALLFEDINLNFPDKPRNDFHLSDFEKERATKCPLLNQEAERSDFRIIVTGGHSGSSGNKIHDNRNYIRNYKPKGYGYVQKPVGGIFDLWTKAGLFRRLIPDNEEKGKRQRGYAPGFYWPPFREEGEKESNGHSAPGKIMLIAQNLVARADTLRNSANTVEECIRGAVLATDALELLRFMTPTLALQALSLKHEFEVRAEVAFLGVGYHFELEKRFDELQREVAVASQFFHKKFRKASQLDTLVSIGNRLMLVFREAGQFDEELICLTRIRSWHRKLRFRQVTGPFDFIASAFMAYAEWLMAKPVRFFGALFVWFIVFWGLWYFNTNLTDKEKAEGVNQLIISASSAWNAFICANPNIAANNWTILILNAIASATGVFHLGVFISYLYSAVTRK